MKQGGAPSGKWAPLFFFLSFFLFSFLFFFLPPPTLFGTKSLFSCSGFLQQVQSNSYFPSRFKISRPLFGCYRVEALAYPVTPSLLVVPRSCFLFLFPPSLAVFSSFFFCLCSQLLYLRRHLFVAHREGNMHAGCDFLAKVTAFFSWPVLVPLPSLLVPAPFFFS